MNFHDYQNIPGVNISLLLELLISPKHFKRRKENPREDTASYRLGRAVHTAVLEPMQFLKDYMTLKLDRIDQQRERSAS